MRKAKITRDTKETKITLEINLDGRGDFSGKSGTGFLDHMLELFAKHGRFDLKFNCTGDADVDFHHTVEDMGLVLGEAFYEALGDRRGINRYGSFLLPMDESLVLVAVDLSGRACLGFDMNIPSAKVGDFDTELAEEFLLGYSRTLAAAVHVRQLSGTNSHHILEAMFKGLGRAMREAVAIEPGFEGEIPSTKGKLV